MTFRMSVNEKVKVKLTSAGVGILQKKHEELRKRIKDTKGIDIGDFVLVIDEDGYYSTPLWKLMKDFGDTINANSDVPFETEVIFLKGKPFNGYE